MNKRLKFVLFFALSMLFFVSITASLGCGGKDDEPNNENTKHFCSFENDVCTSCGNKKGSDGIEYALIDGTYTASYIGSCTDKNIIIASYYQGIPVTCIDAISFNGTDIVSIEIPKSITYIGESAFDGCSMLKTVTIAENSALKTIETKAFFYCTQLESINLPNGLEFVGLSAFDGCSSLKAIEIPKTLTSLEYGTFIYCSSLETITIHETFKKSAEMAFWSANIGKIDYKGTIDQWVNIEFANTHANPMRWGGDLYIDGEKVTKVKLENVTKINANVFSGYNLLEEIEIPKSVTSIGTLAFHMCSSLKTVVLPDSLTEIAPQLFEACRGLEYVIIPENVKTIGSGAFNGCSSLTSIYIPNSVSHIGANVFLDCNSSLVIKCGASEEPLSWDINWNPDGLEVLWGQEE